MDLRKLQSDVDPKSSLEVLEILRADTNLFHGWAKADVQKLSENIKILSFGRNATIIHKNEAVEYFAIVVGGKLLIKQGDKVIGHLGPGDVLGYMSYMEFPGTKIASFDVTAEIEGYIAVFRYDEFKQLSKKDPALSYKVTEMLAKKTLNTVSQQYTGEVIYAPLKLKATSAATNTKRVKDAMDTCPELSEFFQRFDPRDVKNLTKYIEYIEFEREQRIILEGNKTDCLFFLIKGELICFKENKPTVFYKPGAIIGVKEFLYELTWKENVLGKAKGVLLKLERTNFLEMIATSTTSANSFLKNLTWYESKDIKGRHQDRSLFEKIKDQNITNPLNEFLEYEVSKHLEFIEQQKTKSLNNKPVIKDFLNTKELLPLYMHNIHQSLMFAPEESSATTTSTQGKKTMVNIQGCTFLREKMEKQVEEQRLKKGKSRPPAKTAKGAADAKKTGDGTTDEDYEDLRNNYTMLEGENDDLRAKIKELMEEAKGLKTEIRGLREINITSAAKINKTLVHRELISKDLINNDPSSILTKNYSTAFCSFGDVLKEQHLVSAKAKRVAKYAYKWLATIRMKRKMMLTSGV